MSQDTAAAFAFSAVCRRAWSTSWFDIAGSGPSDGTVSDMLGLAL